LTLEVDNPALQSESNLAFKAAKSLQTRFLVPKGAVIRLHKEIPAAAGLGGASSDAAATLRALSLLWEIEPTSVELHELASSIGSDVPFFLTGGTAIGRGRGEKVRPLSQQLSGWVVVAVPMLMTENKTAMMFGMLNEGDFTSGGEVETLSKRIEAGESLASLELANAFRPHAFKKWPVLHDLSDQMKAAGAARISLSGAGPSLFTLVSNETKANAIRDQLLDSVAPNVRVIACKSTSQTPPPVRDNR
jgi:4-diphosphocytidyl-2-C-methyl-D-erythritol kinase